MSLWGNADSAAITGTVAVANGDATVTGTSTVFTTAGQIDIGDLMMIVDVPYRIKSIASATSLELTEDYAGSTDSGLTVLKRETPRNLSVSESDAIFGVDEAEMTKGGDNVADIAVSDGGTGYASAPSVTVAGNTTSVATVSATTGKVTALSVAGTNDDHSSAPAVTIAAPAAKTFNGASAVDPATDQITVSGHKMETGDEVTLASSNTLPTGLTAGTYYIIFVDANNVQLSATVGGAAVDITADGSGNSTLTGRTATGVASLGSGTPPTVTHSGWVKRTVGSGGRAGRVTYETLVAMNTITGDTVDDTEFDESDA